MKLVQATFNDIQLSIYQKRREDDLKQKSISRKRLRTLGSGLGLTKENAEEMIAAKEKQAKETEAKKQHQTWMKIWRMERDAKYAEGVIARKQEEIVYQKLKSFQNKILLFPPSILFLFPIPKQFERQQMLLDKKKRERKRKRLNLKYIMKMKMKMRRRQHSSQMLQVILLCKEIFCRLMKTILMEATRLTMMYKNN